MKKYVILKKFDNCFDDVEEVIFAKGNFENRSMQSRIYLFSPQCDSKGPARPRLSSSLVSSKGEVHQFEN